MEIQKAMPILHRARNRADGDNTSRKGGGTARHFRRDSFDFSCPIVNCPTHTFQKDQNVNIVTEPATKTNTNEIDEIDYPRLFPKSDNFREETHPEGKRVRERPDHRDENCKLVDELCC
ncbi:hypothetical protein TNCV_5067451 [Trichonephila clavipes]|nr:hypothetical protein TNCV_5067451 [Trichonephila clavipes]